MNAHVRVTYVWRATAFVCGSAFLLLGLGLMFDFTSATVVLAPAAVTIAGGVWWSRSQAVTASPASSPAQRPRAERRTEVALAVLVLVALVGFGVYCFALAVGR